MSKELSAFEKLAAIKLQTGKARTVGLSDKQIERFLESDELLVRVISEGYRRFAFIQRELGDKLKLDESELIKEVQKGFLNFYSEGSLCPYIPMVGRGPWVVTLYGSIVYDSGGYGMLGFGHSREVAREVFSKNLVMANIMTPSLSQMRFVNLMKEKIGVMRQNAVCPFNKFLEMNSGSEALTVAARISDAHAKELTDPGGRYEGRKIVFASIRGSFHGRTERPAQVSSSTRKYYQNLASFRNLNNLIEVEPNDINSLRECFAKAEKENLYIESFFLEPVMGEGNPGYPVKPEFYAELRKLTRESDTLLIVDSVQAGLRATGRLSIVDYPGFETLDAPDMEAFSKALNAGQYPVSALALTDYAASLYRQGIYGNTMSGNPRGLEVACAVLSQVDDDFVNNVVNSGKELLGKLDKLKTELGAVVLKTQGTGLLLSVQLDETLCEVEGRGNLEEWMRVHGLNVVHGGKNSIRLTPHFRLNSAESDLIVEVMKNGILACSKN